MRNKKEFDSLEDWADRNLKQLGISSAPEGFLNGVMDKINAPSVEYIAPEKPSVLIIWIRIMVVFASLILLVGGLFWDPNWLQSWWSQTGPGMTIQLMGQLFASFKHFANALAGLVPTAIWIGLGVSLAFAYLITAVIGSTFIHFTFRRVRTI
ncbi:MAG: hypothetical protein HOH33_01275 [Verrucomicrobia bacterium]|jgi:hypothetical protein|nr:hypothetical protein [Verrucomicrobiota bacterium]